MILASRPALVLNADHAPVRPYPLSTWSGEDTLKAYINGKIDAVRYYDITLRSQSFTYRVPSVVALRSMVSPPKVVAFNRKNVFLRDEFRCQYCLQQFPPKELTFDHVVPRCHGGLSSWENIVSACGPCNRKKADRRDMSPRVPPRQPSPHAMRRKSAPAFQIVDQSWADFLYWDVELER